MKQLRNRRNVRSDLLGCHEQHAYGLVSPLVIRSVDVAGVLNTLRQQRRSVESAAPMALSSPVGDRG